MIIIIFILIRLISFFIFFFFNDTATTEIYTLSLHDALPILCAPQSCINSWGLLPDLALRSTCRVELVNWTFYKKAKRRSEEHTSELQSQSNLVCRLLLEKKKKKSN